MHTIHIGFAAHPFNQDLPELDARQLRDIGVTRAADGSLRLLEDPSVEVTPNAPAVKSRGSWGAWLAGFLIPYAR